MSLDFFRIFRGLELDDTILLLTGVGSPGSSIDTDIATVGSYYTNHSNGDLWIKVLPGPGINSWRLQATQNYVQSLLALGISWREPVRVVETNLTTLPIGVPNNPILIDGVNILNGQRVLFSNIPVANVYIYDQATGLFNEDLNNQSHGDTIFVQEGTNADTIFQYNGTSWQPIITPTTNTEIAYIRNFIGKNIIGNIPPDYTSTNIIADGDNLVQALSKLDNAISSISVSGDHGSLTELLDDDHPQYVHTSISRNITAQHNISPSIPQAPFILGTNAQGQLVTGLNADQLDGLNASDFQPIDADLTSIANINTIGFAVRSGTNTWVTRSIIGTAGNIFVLNGNGASTPIQIDLISTGVTPGTYKSLTVDTFGRAITGTNPTTLAGFGIIDAQPLNAFLSSISTVASSGVMVKDGNDLVTRSIVAGSTRIIVNNPTGVAGNVSIDVGILSLDDLDNINISSATTNDVLVFNGVEWENRNVSLKLYVENPVSPGPSFAIGENSIAFGIQAQADADESFAFGQQSLARFPGITQANGRFGSQGDAQSGRYLLRSTSINASNTELFLDGTNGSERLLLPSDSSWVFNITIIGHQTDATTGRAAFKLNGIIFRQGTINIEILGKVTKDILARTNSSLDAFVLAEDDALKIIVKGEHNKIFRWVALVETVEITN